MRPNQIVAEHLSALQKSTKYLKRRLNAMPNFPMVSTQSVKYHPKQRERILSEELSAVSDIVNPNDIWLKVEDDIIVELLLKTERALVYASIFTKKETVYLLVADTVPGWYEMSTAKPAGW